MARPAERNLQVFSTGSGEPTFAQAKHSLGPWGRGRVFGVAVAPDGQTFAVGGETGVVEIRQCNKLLSKFQTKGREIWSLQYSPDGKRLLVAADDTVGLWDLGTKKALWRLDEAGISRKAHMTADGRLVAVIAQLSTPAKTGHVVRLLSGTTGKVVGSVVTKGPTLEQVRLIQKGKQVWVAGGGGVYRYQVNPPRLLQTIAVKHPADFAYHAGRGLLAVVDHDEVLRMIRARDGEVLHRFNLLQGGYGEYTPVFSADGKTLATGGRSNTLWDVQTGMRLHHFGGRLTTGLRFLARGARILVTGNDGSIRILPLPSLAPQPVAKKVTLPLSLVRLERSNVPAKKGCYVTSAGGRMFSSPRLLFHAAQRSSAIRGHHTVVAQSPLYHRAKGGLLVEDVEVTGYHRRGNHFFLRVGVRFNHSRSARDLNHIYLRAALPAALSPGTYRVLVSYDELVKGVATEVAAQSVTTSFVVR